ncbi:MAG: ABC transporter permease subunit [Candidatus Omnitrophica bacterium]|nr:ABC transporter permease subunit [Candidatus Omnitrophota bacterium]
MRKINAIAFKELTALFGSPLAYVVLFLSTAVFNIFFFMIIDQNREAHLKDIFTVMEFLLVFFVPIFTMKSFAEENASGTMEFLLTAPVRKIEIVLGKFAGIKIFLFCVIAPTFVYYFIFSHFADFDKVTALWGYLGIWLEVNFFAAIGLFISSLCRSQVVAAMSTYVILFILYFSMSFKMYVEGKLNVLVSYIAVMSHSENFFTGIFLLSDVVYFLSGIIFFLLLTRLMLNRQ